MKFTTRGTVKSLALLAAVGLSVLIGGCAADKATDLKSAGDVEGVIANSPQPVLMMFYKQGCAACAALEPTMDKLAGEYRGRAVVDKYMILNFALISTAPELSKKYDIVMVPHVILFVNGQTRQQWVAEYDINAYRKALDAVVQPATEPSAKKP